MQTLSYNSVNSCECKVLLNSKNVACFFRLEGAFLPLVANLYAICVNTDTWIMGKKEKTTQAVKTTPHIN